MSGWMTLSRLRPRLEHPASSSFLQSLPSLPSTRDIGDNGGGSNNTTINLMTVAATTVAATTAAVLTVIVATMRKATTKTTMGQHNNQLVHRLEKGW